MFRLIFAEGDECGAAPALIRGSKFEAFHERMLGQKLRYRAAQYSLAMAVDDTDAFDIREVSLVEKFVDAIERLICGHSDNLQLGRKLFGRFGENGDSALCAMNS